MPHAPRLQIDDLFRMGHNRYPIQAKYDGHIDINDLWQPMPDSDSDSDSDGDDGDDGEDDDARPRAKEKNAFYEWLDTHELDADVKPAKDRIAIGKVVARGGTFHAEMVLSAMADDYEQFTQARRLEKSNPDKMVQMCHSLLEQPDCDSAIRVGDCFALLVE